jgi:glycyl-tRNA synthetase
LPPALAPIKCAILPLVKKDGLPELAEKIYEALRFDFNTFIEDKDSIGKRYRRMDAIGTPFCVTVDHDSLTQGDVTIRYRDTMEQERVPIDSLREIIEAATSMKTLLKQI